MADDFSHGITRRHFSTLTAGVIAAAQQLRPQSTPVSPGPVLDIADWSY